MCAALRGVGSAEGKCYRAQMELDEGPGVGFKRRTVRKAFKR